MSNLYQIEEDYLALMYELEESGGEVTPELGLRLEIVKEDFDRKVLAYSKFIAMLEGDVKSAVSEIERISQYIITKSNMVDRLKENLLGALKLFGIKDPKKDIWRYEIGTFMLSTRKSQAAEVTDFNALPDKYKKVAIRIANLSMEQRTHVMDLLHDVDDIKVDEGPLKLDIKNDILAGEEVPGAEVRTKYSLNLR